MMSMSTFARSLHRWTSMLFAVVVAGIFASLGFGVQPVDWVYYLPLAPLLVLFGTGVYLFVLPYLRRRKPMAR